MRRKTISLFLGAASIAGTVALGGAAEASTLNSTTADRTHHVVWQADEVGPMHVPNHGFNTYSWDGVSWRGWCPAEWCSSDLCVAPGHGAAIAQLSE